MFRILFSVPFFMSVLILAGCSNINRNFSDSHPQMVAAPDTVSAKLAEAADRASLSLEKLAAVEYARTPGASLAPAGDAPAELRRAVTVNWVGPVEPLAKTMAERAGYNFIPMGSLPPTPVIVSIDVENRPLIDVLRDLGLQLGVRGDIKVDSAQRVIELHYPPDNGVSAAE
jgi:defect-in-organelle-trafficking protein DotD